MDWESIVVGLLHDTIEDTNLVTFEKIKEQFGATVRHIVEGETKVSKLGKLKYKNESNSVQDVKAHDLRQMFLAMTEEMATVNGAKAVLWDNEIGSLKVGKKVHGSEDLTGKARKSKRTTKMKADS
ncbi:putative GTP diphosphokinase RSH1, chloroplastic, partial [Tanacetum coccineum]